MVFILLHDVMTIDEQRTYICLIPFELFLSIFMEFAQTDKHHSFYDLRGKFFVLLFGENVFVLLSIKSYVFVFLLNVGRIVV